MKLSTKKALEVLQGNSPVVNGYDEIVTETKGQRVVKRVFKKIDAQTKMKARMNFTALQAVAENYDKVRKELIETLSKGRDEIIKEDNPDAFAAFTKQMEKVDNDEIEVNLYKLDEDKLIADPNFPDWAIVLLLPILNPATIEDE